MKTEHKRWKIVLSATINGRDQFLNDYYFASTKQDALSQAVSHYGDKLISIAHCIESKQIESPK